MGSLQPGRTIKYMTDAHGQVWANYEGDRAIKKWLVGSPLYTYDLRDSSLKEYKEMVRYSQFSHVLDDMLYNCLRVYRLYKYLKHSRSQ